METNYIHEDVPGGVPVKMWTRGVPVEDEAKRQLTNAARLPIVFKHIAAMPDVHFGIGATVGSVIPTLKAIIPAAVGVDIGCGMMACKTTLTAEDLPDNLAPLRSAIERAVPHGRSPGARDPGAWSGSSSGKVPGSVDTAWAQLEPDFTELCRDYPKLAKTNNRVHLGTLGTGNHFIEVCLDEAGFVWFMLHSGSRGVGNAIGTMFIELAKQDALRNNANLPDRDLAYFEEGARYFGDYVRAVGWGQKFAALNREVMMKRVIEAAKTVLHKSFQSHIEAVNCHHNYVQMEHHFGQDVYVTRKGAVSAKAGQLGIIPGSMGARSYIVRGKGNPDSFESCSHGAGRAMSRGEAKRRFTLADHRAATEGVECRKDKDVIDETPAAYKDIDAVMAAQSDLVDVVHVLKQVVCVKG
jgi:tRNA-splicing ligase RtcB